jgi:hypothetical protein
MEEMTKQKNFCLDGEMSQQVMTPVHESILPDQEPGFPCYSEDFITIRFVMYRF